MSSCHELHFYIIYKGVKQNICIIDISYGLKWMLRFAIQKSAIYSWQYKHLITIIAAANKPSVLHTDTIWKIFYRPLTWL